MALETSQTSTTGTTSEEGAGMDLESWTLSFKNRDGSWNPTDVIALVVLAVAAISLVAAIGLMMNQAGAR
jgi:hypothetical protein